MATGAESVRFDINVFDEGDGGLSWQRIRSWLRQ